MLQSGIPSNQFGPTGYIKPDAISMPDGDIPPLNQITQKIDYIDSFPIVDGLPIWERLDCEPLDHYELFKAYRLQDKRSLSRIAKENNLPTAFVHSLSKIYHWQLRVEAYDRYQEVQFEKERNKAIVAMEGRHKKAAEELFDIVLKEIKKWKEHNLLTTASLKELKDLLETAIKFERLSLGISPDKPITEKDVTPIKKVININTKNQTNQTLNVGPRLEKAEVSRLQEVVDVLTMNNALPQKTVKNYQEIAENRQKTAENRQKTVKNQNLGEMEVENG
ncbi:MAG: hypothetical protein ACTSPI_04250 [Candidatus Heimdallarchaeaceae archaeon]